VYKNCLFGAEYKGNNGKYKYYKNIKSEDYIQNMKGEFLMKNTTRKVLILKNVNSELIEQAFLILKDSASDGDSKVVREAEKIVEKYMGKKSDKKREEKKYKFMATIWFCALSFGLGMLALAFFV